MMRSEFEKLMGKKLDHNEYNIIETIYFNYPEEIEKDTIVKMYNEGGISNLQNLYKRAKEMEFMSIEEQIDLLEDK